MANHKIPRPRDPTVAESFETKISDQQMRMLLDPKGFMSEEEKQRQSSNNPAINNDTKTQASDNQKTQNGKTMEPEYGFKPKGPEPTRYGDWEVKGKCVDF